MAYKMQWRHRRGLDAVSWYGNIQHTNLQLRSKGWPELDVVDDVVLYQGTPLKNGDYIVGDASQMHPQLGHLIFGEQEFDDRFEYIDTLEVGEEIITYHINWASLSFGDIVETLTHNGVLYTSKNMTQCIGIQNPYQHWESLPEIKINNSDAIEELWEWWQCDRLHGAMAWFVNRVGLLPAEYSMKCLERMGYDIPEAPIWDDDRNLYEARMDELVTNGID